MKKNKTKEKEFEKNMLTFLHFHNDVSIFNIEEMLETLEDMDYLSDKGKEFGTYLWEKFIKKSEDK